MTEVQEREASPSTTNRAWLSGVGTYGAVAIALVVSLGLVVASASRGRVEVGGRADLHDVAFGWPVAWLHQNQDSLNPRFPWTTRLVSPWEHPISVSTGAFVVDVLVFFAVVMAVFAAAALAIRAAGRSGRA